tara:strand:- start:1998 stop:2426 length:429 start_codon:yes stop_codon:yes gene_type:complete
MRTLNPIFNEIFPKSIKMKIILSAILLSMSFASQAQPGNVLRAKSDVVINDQILKEEMLLDIVSTNNFESYGIEYELIDYSFPPGDSSILEHVGVHGAYTSRKLNDDVELYDLAKGVKILVYSYKKALSRREALTEADPIKQ